MASDEKEPVAVQYLGDLERVTLGPDDVVVLSVDSVLSGDAVTRLRNALKAVLGDSQRVIVLGKGMKLGVLGPDVPAGVETLDVTTLSSRAKAYPTSNVDLVGVAGGKASAATPFLGSEK